MKFDLFITHNEERVLELKNVSLVVAVLTLFGFPRKKYDGKLNFYVLTPEDNED